MIYTFDDTQKYFSEYNFTYKLKTMLNVYNKFRKDNKVLLEEIINTKIYNDLENMILEKFEMKGLDLISKYVDVCIWSELKKKYSNYGKAYLGSLSPDELEFYNIVMNKELIDMKKPMLKNINNESEVRKVV